MYFSDETETWKSYVKFALRLSIAVGVIWSLFFGMVIGPAALMCIIPVATIIFVLMMLSRAIVDSIQHIYLCLNRS